MDSGRVTIREFAARAGVSIATVSNVFSGNKPVNADLRERVPKVAEELAYQVDRAASQLRSGQARVVGVLVPDLDDVFFTSLASQIEVLAQPITEITEIAEAAWSRLRARMAGDQALPAHCVLQASLQVRDSVRDLAAGAEHGNSHDPHPNPETPAASQKAVH